MVEDQDRRTMPVPSQPKQPGGAKPAQESLGFWNINTHVSNHFICVGGKTRSDLQDPTKFKTEVDAPFMLLLDILEKIKQAVLNGEEVITVSVEPDPAGGEFIIPDSPALLRTSRAPGHKPSSRKQGGQAEESEKSKDKS
jgi:hypothetical protein